MKQNVYKLANIDCAACALKIEGKLNNLKGVESCNLSYMLLKLFVTYDETIVSDDDIELCVHQTLNGVKIVQKNGEDFVDTYETPNILKKILLGGRRKK